MRIKAGSTVIIPRNSRRLGDISANLADNASLSLEKPPPPPPPLPKCSKPTKGAKGSKAAKDSKCTPPKSDKDASKVASKGNSSVKTASTQHKSESTVVAKSAKNGNAKPSTKKEASKTQ